MARAKSLYRRDWSRRDILELFRVIDWLLRLPEEFEERLWSDIQAYEEIEKMPYVTSVERIGIRKGLQQGLAAERQLLQRMVRKRFGAEVAEQSEPLLARIDDPDRLEDLGEALLDSADGEAWLRVLRTMTPITHNPLTDNPPAPAGEVLVRVEGVGKTFCRDLKKSLWYGVRDIAAERVPGQRRAPRAAPTCAEPATLLTADGKLLNIREWHESEGHLC